MLLFPSTNRNKRFLFSCDKLKKKLGPLFSQFYWCLGPLHMSPATGLPVTEMDVIVCSLGKLSARSTWIHAVQETKAKWWNINLHLRLLYGFVDSFNFTTTSAVEKHTSQKLCHFFFYFCHCCWDSEATLSKNVSSRPQGLNCSYGKIF